MHPTLPARRSGAIAALVIALFAPSPFATATEPLLSSDEIRRLDRENDFWRRLRAGDDAEANLARLRQGGASDAELDAFAPKLAALWEVDARREWGWLRAEQIEAIKEVDRAFVPRVRAARLRAVTGIDIDAAHRGETPLAVNAHWQRAVIRALDYDQLGEFRLMNAPSAHRAARHFENIPLTDDERRTIYDWQHDYEQILGPAGARTSAARSQATLDYHRRLRELVGDDRFAVYLASAEPNFARMHDALGEEVDNATALDAWAIREQLAVERTKPRDFGVSVQKVVARAEERLKVRLGEALFARYIDSPDAGWLAESRLRISGRPRR